MNPEDELWVTGDYGETVEHAPKTLTVKAASINIERLAKRKPADIDHLLEHAEIHGQAASLPATAWTVDELAGPNVTDRESVLSFARMAANAYVQEHNKGDWIPVGGGFNYTDDFGWEADGLRGHIFADETNGTIVIGLKGTSVPFLDDLSVAKDALKANIDSGTSPAVFDGADTTGNDKLNDNLFGSCCCGQGGQWTWKQVCDCMTSTYTCNSTCLVRSLRQKSHYYWAARDLYHNVTERYPKSEVWLAGHSLGGVVTSMLGLTYGLPTVTFEAFPDALGASRLGLPTPPGYHIGSHQTRAKLGIYHFGHTADPIFMGTCNAGTSFCTIAGYAFQSVCHTGQTCTYDTVGDLGWRVGIGTHKISNVIKDVLEKYDTVPSCETDVECTDCALWKFFESNGSDPITSTSSSSSTTRTRTETCKTPGWWGCLDESTTSASTTTTTSSSTESTTTTCQTPGWFGCKDETTTTTTTSSTKAAKPSAAPVPTITTTRPLPTSSSTHTCETPGWLGCRDPTSTSAAPSSTTSHSTPVATPAHSTCRSPDWFGLVCADPTTPTSPKPSSSHLPTTRRKTCVRRHWYGVCQEWHYEAVEHKGDL